MDKPIRLLRVATVTDNRRGGMSRTMHETADHLRTMGFDVDFAFEEAFENRISPAWRRFAGPWEAALLLRKLRKTRGEYDIIEVHEPLALGPGVLRRFSLDRAKLAAFSYGLENRGWKAMLEYNRQHHFPLRLKSRITGGVQSRQSAAGLRLCDHVVCSNASDVAYLQKRGMRPDQLTRHHSGVDDSMLIAGNAVGDAPRRDILFVGGWLDRKGVPDLVPAVAATLRENPGLKFTVAGSSQDANFVRRGFPSEVHGQIEVIPRVDNDADLAAIYARHGIFLLPSFYEGQPLVMIEAAALGLAIVTTPICGMLDFIRDGENGVFTPVGDAAALKATLKTLVADPAKVARLGTEARRDATSHTWRASAENLAASYRRLVGRS